MNETTIPVIREIHTENSFEFDNITFSSCKNEQPANNTIAIYDALCDVKINEPHARIARLTDGGSLYQIINDTTCMKYPLNPYPSGITLNDFNLKELQEQRFCMMYLAR